MIHIPVKGVPVKGATPTAPAAERSRLCLLVTGFGPFPGAPFNPSAALVRRLARLRRPALADARIVAHVFRTGYAAVDAELPALLARHRPDAVLMFGVATRARAIRIETRARNTLCALPDAAGQPAPSLRIAHEARAGLAIRAPRMALLRAARSARLAARLSQDAGRYLCNYLYWRALEAAARPGGPRLAAFVHVPPRLRPPDLARCGAALLVAMRAAARRPR